MLRSIVAVAFFATFGVACTHIDTPKSIAPQVNKKTSSPKSLTYENIDIVDMSSLSQAKHIVKKGETLYSISRTYGTTIKTLRALNHGININDMKIGSVLFLPK